MTRNASASRSASVSERGDLGNESPGSTSDRSLGSSASCGHIDSHSYLRLLNVSTVIDGREVCREVRMIPVALSPAGRRSSSVRSRLGGDQPPVVSRKGRPVDDALLGRAAWPRRRDLWRRGTILPPEGSDRPQPVRDDRYRPSRRALPIQSGPHHLMQERVRPEPDSTRIARAVTVSRWRSRTVARPGPGWRQNDVKSCSPDQFPRGRAHRARRRGARDDATRTGR